MTAYDVTIDGVPLNSPRSGVDGFEMRRGLPLRRHTEAVAPGMNGATPLGGAFDTPMYILRIWVLGHNSGASPSALGMEQELDRILKPFLRPLVTVDWVHPDGSIRRARCRVSGISQVETNETQGIARATVALENPGVFWRGLSVLTTYSAATGAATVITAAQASTAPIDDAIFEITGPATNPKLATANGWVQFLGTVPPGQTLRINNESLQATLNAFPVSHQLAYAGSNPRFLDLYPGATVTLTASGTGSGFGWSVAARPAYI